MQGTHLFHLFKLVDSEDSPGVLAVRTGFLSETSRVTGVPASAVSAEFNSMDLSEASRLT